MTKRERVMAALRGEPVDRVPLAFWLHNLHVCGSRVHFDEFIDYPVTALSWATVPGNPTLGEGHRRTGRAVIGGLPAKPQIASMTASEIAERTLAAIEAMTGRWLLLGPDCSVNPDTPEALFHAAAGARTSSSGRRDPAV